MEGTPEGVHLMEMEPIGSGGQTLDANGNDGEVFAALMTTTSPTLLPKLKKLQREWVTQYKKLIADARHEGGEVVAFKRTVLGAEVEVRCQPKRTSHRPCPCPFHSALQALKKLVGTPGLQQMLRWWPSPCGKYELIGEPSH